jgi:hypothetical protein
MKSRWIAIVGTLVIMAACGESSNQSDSNTQDSTVTTNPDNTTVNPGIPDSTGNSAGNSMQDTARNHGDSTPMNHK